LQLFCFNLQKPEVIQLPLPSVSAQARACPHIHESLGESIRERVVMAGAWRDPQPPLGGRRHLSLA